MRVSIASTSSQRLSVALVSSHKLGRVCDRAFMGGILFLIFFTPIAFGSVHPWAFALMEVVVFLLVGVWMGKWLLGTGEQEDGGVGERGANRGLGLTFLPLILFVAFICFQLVPLPPALLHFLSPKTYEFYTHSLPGWPEQVPYESIASVESVASVASIGSIASVEWSVAKEGHETTSISSPQPVTLDAPQSTFYALWRPLSLAPQLTSTNLLKFLAYTGLFLLVLFYPLSVANDQQSAVEKRTSPEGRFFRRVLLTILWSGLFVAVLGVVQQFTWNGKILWFFVPYDWGAPHLKPIPRASGPFVNPDHFANYLALIFPLVIAGTLSGSVFTPQQWRKTLRPVSSGAARLFCGFVAFTLTLGILLSLSRAGWVGTGLGVGILFWIFLSLPQERRLVFLRQSKRLTIGFALTGFVFVLVVALFFVGSAGRSQVDIRLEQTVMQETSLWRRVGVWQDSLSMTQDFPVFGVGLGAWPELHPHYRQPPWSRVFYTEAHNDYLQVLAETGLLGFALLAWFFWQGGRRLYHGLWTASPGAFPLMAALVAALGVMAFHEFFDFNLQIPANAFLFTLLFALALRLTEAGVSSLKSQVSSPEFRVPSLKSQVSSSKFQVPSRFRVPIAVGVGVIASGLCFFALRQTGFPYPYNLQEPASPLEARELLLSYPARSSGHQSLSLFLLDKAAPTEDWLKELQIALWLAPLNPYTHDLYAAGLAEQGRNEEALQEMTRSISVAPVLAAHLYLNDDGLSSLSQREADAVEEGFKQALTSGYEGAVDGLGTFYMAVERFADAGKLYEEAALREEEDAQLRYLLKAGSAYARAEDEGKERAEALFRQAAQLAPQDPRAYQYLAVQVFAPQGDVASAKTVVAEGIHNGADRLTLFLSLAEAAQKAGDRKEAKEALQKALALRQSSFEANYRLGLLYLREKDFNRATLLLRKAAHLRPDSASAFFNLGLAEEGRYQFFDAQKAYARAVELAPNNMSFRVRYQTFQRKVAEQKGQ